jgi:hypothetical protein
MSRLQRLWLAELVERRIQDRPKELNRKEREVCAKSRQVMGQEFFFAYLCAPSRTLRLIPLTTFGTWVWMRDLPFTIYHLLFANHGHRICSQLLSFSSPR